MKSIYEKEVVYPYIVCLQDSMHGKWEKSWNLRPKTKRCVFIVTCQKKIYGRSVGRHYFFFLTIGKTVNSCSRFRNAILVFHFRNFRQAVVNHYNPLGRVIKKYIFYTWLFYKISTFLKSFNINFKDKGKQSI